MLVLVHVALACAAFAAGIAAITRRAARGPHRRLGLLYVACWAGLGATGMVIGARRPGLSPFEILNATGLVIVATAYAIPAVGAVRRRLGSGWLRMHVRLVLASLAFIAVAAVNQFAGPALHAVGLPYPGWAFWLLVASPFVVLPPVVRRLVPSAPRATRGARRAITDAGAGAGAAA